VRLADFQRQFQAAILDPGAPGRVDGLTFPGRVRIHHAHFWTRMGEFIGNWQPLLARYLGAAEMDQLVRRYIAAHPPRTVVAIDQMGADPLPTGRAGRAPPPRLASLVDVCAQLADFLRTAEPWSAWPIVGELAAIDYRRALIRGHAEEATVTRAMLAAIDPAAIASIRFRLKQRSALITSMFRFDLSRLHQLARETPLDLRPVHWLVHLTGRRYATIELDQRWVHACEPLVEGMTMAGLDAHMAGLGFTGRERRRFRNHMLDNDLLVALRA
jgi:hypothetical protein